MKDHGGTGIGASVVRREDRRFMTGQGRDRVALVVAETLAQAKSAAELIAVDYSPLPAVVLADALKDGAPKVWDEAPGNVSFTLERGNAATVNKQFATAAHVTALTLT